MSCKNPDNQNRANGSAKTTGVVKDWLQFAGVLAKASVEGVVEFWGKEKPAEPAPVVIAPIVSEETAMALVDEPLECEDEELNDKNLKQEKKELKSAKKAEKKEAKLLKKQEDGLKKAEKKQASQLKKAEKKKATQLKKEEKKQDDLLKKEEKKQEDLQKKEEKKQDNLLAKEEKKQEKAEKKRAKAEPVEEPVREEPVEK